MKWLSDQKGIKQLTGFLKSREAQFICCECNSVLSEGQLLHTNALSKRCPYGHLVIQLRPFFISLIQGFGWGTLVIGGAAVAVRSFEPQFPVLGIAGAICSALACKRMLDGWEYKKLEEPAKWIARQRFSEAIGVWTAIVLSTLVTLT